MRKGKLTLLNSDYDMVANSKGIKGKSNSYLKQPKKFYKIKFDKKRSLFWLTYKAKKWTLIVKSKKIKIKL